jgi:hypothetical protein
MPRQKLKLDDSFKVCGISQVELVKCSPSFLIIVQRCQSTPISTKIIKHLLTQTLLPKTELQHFTMKLAVFSTLFAGAAAFAPSTPASSSQTTSTLAAGKADLEALAQKANPALGFYDPLALAEKDFWGKGNEATIGFLRQSEIKHGRIAMFAFVGYIVQSNFVFPWAQTLAGGLHPSAELRYVAL